MFEFSAEDITSDYGFLYRLVNTFTIDTDEYYLMCYKVNDMKTSKNLVGLYYFTLCAHKSSPYLVPILQIDSFNWGLQNYIDLVLCIMGSH